MIRSPIFEARRTGWWTLPEGWLQIPIGAAAFLLALLLVTTVTSLAGSVLGEALSAPKAGLLLLRKLDARSDRRSVTAGELNRGLEGHPSEKLKLNPYQTSLNE